MKLKNKLLIVATVIFAMILAVVGIVFSRNPTYKKSVGEYKDIDKLGSVFIHSNIEAYKIGVSDDGMPIFVDPNAAFKQAKKDFAKGLKQLEEEFNLRPVTKYNFEAYKNFGWQTLSDDKDIKMQCHEITCFFGFFEDSIAK